MVNPQDTAEGMEPVLAAGDDLLYIGISDGGKGDRIIILDTASGRKISTIRVD